MTKKSMDIDGAIRAAELYVTRLKYFAKALTIEGCPISELSYQFHKADQTFIELNTLHAHNKNCFYNVLYQGYKHILDGETD
jgi:hypothetical protein